MIFSSIPADQPILLINSLIKTMLLFTTLKALRQLVWRDQKMLLLRWNYVLDWKKFPISMFSEIFSPYKHLLAVLFKKQEINFPRFLVIASRFMLPFWNIQKLTVFYRTAKSTVTGSLNLPEISLTWFL